MKVMECIGRIRVCAFCSRKFWETDEMVFVDESYPDITICCVGDTAEDQLICVNGWKSIHPCVTKHFVKKRICEVQPYFTWPDLRQVRA